MAEQTQSVGSRIPDELYEELVLELRRTGKKKSHWIQEAIEEKLQNDNKEIIDAKIQSLKSQLLFLEKQREQIKTKVKDINKIPEIEIPFLLQTKSLLERDPTFIKGRMALYKNKFKKDYKINQDEFYQILDNAEFQTQLKKLIPTPNN